MAEREKTIHCKAGTPRRGLMGTETPYGLRNRLQAGHIQKKFSLKE